MKKMYDQDGIVIICEDNQKVLEQIESNSLQLIYCDILYNSGKEFTNYSDNLGGPGKAMSWYRPRFKEMRRILKDNGSIWIHCNWRLDSYIRILLDEIFGVDSYKNCIHRQHSDIRGFVGNFDSQEDCIFYYVKKPENYIFNEIRDGIIRDVPLCEQGFHPQKSKIITACGQQIDLISMGMHLLIDEQKLSSLEARGEVILKKGVPWRRSDVKPVGNLWCEKEMLDQYNRAIAVTKDDAYDTPKPEPVLGRILSICTNEGDKVGDFFLGGGTTAVVTKKMKREGIFCDINEVACIKTIEKLYE